MNSCNMSKESKTLTVMKAIVRQRRITREVNSDPVFNLQDNDNVPNPNETIPDVIQTHVSNLLLVRKRSQSITLSMDERVREAGSILKRISREFEESYQVECVEVRENTPIIQPSAEEQGCRELVTSDTHFPS
ncbi:uncharacterized protein LOC111084915 [Limulus polyphemus]|uniref:Uncharacterized protein LOC111084915 n=1 Tax=Limulus polyphemus TaxID=6850 RepID=A0ABM1S0P8_LIMPO|nr:uncharacterized protein LOC111084915 [Limulus polyphemus]